MYEGCEGTSKRGECKEKKPGQVKGRKERERDRDRKIDKARNRKEDEDMERGGGRYDRGTKFVTNRERERNKKQDDKETDRKKVSGIPEDKERS